MTIIKRIPLKALSILAIGFLLGYGSGAKTGHKITWLTTEKTLEKTGVAEKVNEPSNEITNKIEVPKIKKSQPVQIIMSPNNEQIAVRDTCLGDLSKLSEGQKRRLEKWLN